MVLALGGWLVYYTRSIDSTYWGLAQPIFPTISVQSDTGL